MNDPIPAPRRTRAGLKSTDPVAVAAALRDPRARSRAGLRDLAAVVERSRAGAFGMGRHADADRQAAHAVVAVAATAVLLAAARELLPSFAEDAIRLGADPAEVDAARQLAGGAS